MDEQQLELKGVSALVLDDVPTMRRLLGEVLRGLGCGKVYEAAHIDAAMQVVLTSKVDIIFCDVALGGEDGLEFVREVRSLDCRSASRAPIIMVSAHSTRKRVEEAARAGANSFLTKPISVRGVAEQLMRALGVRPPAAAERSQAAPATEPMDVFFV
ncbi:MAG TPA: response regulator [Caulobacteraceae bacterium]|nr:response regulator [Caulobacteraceae bacterium]